MCGCSLNPLPRDSIHHGGSNLWHETKGQRFCAPRGEPAKRYGGHAIWEAAPGDDIMGERAAKTRRGNRIKVMKPRLIRAPERAHCSL